MYDIIIVGGGPAGCAAAIRAANLQPHRASRILLLDRERFPRIKICGGGVVQRGDQLLRYLGVEPGVHSTPVDVAQFVFPTGALTIPRPAMFRVVKRDEFDHALLNAVRSRGVEVREGATVLDLRHGPDGVLVSTDRESFGAKVVIGADGAKGIARKTVISGSHHVSMIGIEVVTPAAGAELTPRGRRTAVFDFRCIADGVQGYSWHFPVGASAAPQVNRGIFHSHIGGRPSRLSLKSYLAASLREGEVAVHPEQIKGHPAHIYNPSLPGSAPRLLLAGDAVGVEPLLGEGISSALETGILAANAACRALRTGDFSFRRYDDDLRASHRMRSIRFKRAIADRFYTRYPRPWVLLGAIGVSVAYDHAAQAWEWLGTRR